MAKVETPLASPQIDRITRIDTRELRIGCWVMLIVITLARAWFTRYELMGGDSLAYLDIARAVADVEPRFIGGWLVLLFAGVICACSLPTDSGTRRAVSYIGLATLITAGAAVILQASREAIGIDHAAGRSSRQASIAVFLLNNGLHPGDGVALIGNGSEAYIFSRLSHPALDFWESPTEQQQRALEILERTRARAVIAGSQDALAASVPSILPPQWKKIGDTGAYVYFFPADQQLRGGAVGNPK